MKAKKTMPVLLLGIVMSLSIIYAVGQAHAQAICKQPPPGLISWWGAEGDAKDIVGSNHGSLENGATFAAGKVGQAFSFDGVNDFVKVPNDSSLNLQSQLSVEFWMKGDAANPMNGCCQGLVTTDFYNIEGFDPERGVGFGVSKNNGGSFVAAGTEWGNAYPSGFGLIPGQWHHVVGTYDGTILKQFVDGRLTSALIFSGDISPMIIGGTSFLSFGSEDGRAYFTTRTANRYFKGLIDEVSIYNRVLSAEEVKAIFDAGDQGKCKGVPFTNFSASLTVGMGSSANDDTFVFSGTANEGAGSDGISPLTENVGLRFGNFSVIIPAGSFSLPSKGNRTSYTFTGVVNGISLSATLASSSGGAFTVRMKGSGANLTGLVLPLQAELIIGDNGASTTLAQVQIKSQ